MKPLSSHHRGALLVLVLVFGTIFFLIVVAFMGFVVTQSRLQVNTLEKERALGIAESGLNYYKWYLAHNPDDVTNGTGVPGPYVVPYEDSESGIIGEYSLDIASTTYCGVVSNIEITSTGYTNDRPDLKRSVYGRYARPTVAEYAYIINSNVWAGADRVITGPYHSNGGVRMDGTNNSTVTSGQETWSCTGSFGCNPTVTRNGVFGAGPNSPLWAFPSVPINFTGLTVNLASMKERAQNGGGIYIPDSGDWGYHITFQSNGNVVVRVVDRTWSHDEYSTEDGWRTANNLLRATVPYATYTINPSCPLIFVEDKVWLDGVVNQKVTIAAADTDTPGNDYSMILNGSITYSTSSAGLLAIAEDDMLVGYSAPDNMVLNGIFMAQTGKFGRNHYVSSGNGGQRYRNSLTINGTIVSNGREGTKWNNSGVWISGFNNRVNSYDRNLVDNPPPLAPNTSDDYRFVEWRQEL